MSEAPAPYEGDVLVGQRTRSIRGRRSRTLVVALATIAALGASIGIAAVLLVLKPNAAAATASIDGLRLPMLALQTALFVGLYAAWPKVVRWAAQRRDWTGELVDEMCKARVKVFWMLMAFEAFSALRLLPI